MKSSFIEPLESRIAPSGIYSFITDDGDMVKVTSSKGTNTDLNDAVFIASGTGVRVVNIDLSPAIFSGTDLIFTVTKGPNGDGLENVGRIDGGGNDLGKIRIVGDLGVIDCGANSDGTPALAALTVRSMGRFGLSSGATDLTSTINGALGVFKVGGDIKDAYLHVVGSHGTIGSVKVGGSLIGDGAGTGIIDAFGNIGPVRIGGDVQGGAGSSSGAIQSDTGAIARVKIGGSLIGGTGQFSGEIRSSLDLGPVIIGGNVIGGGGANSGFIATFVGLGGTDDGAMKSITIGGSLIGGVGNESGLIRSTAAIGPVTIAHDVKGGAGNDAGKIDATTTLGSVTIGGSLLGGAGNQALYTSSNGVQHFAQIFAQGAMGKVKIGHDVSGANGKNSASIKSNTSIKSLSIGGSLIGSTGFSSGFVFTQNIGPVKIGHDLIGGSEEVSGALYTGGSIAALRVGGSIVGGSNYQTGYVTAGGAIGLIKVGHDLLGGSSLSSGSIVSNAAITSVAIGGSVIGTGFSTTGTISASEIGSVEIGRDLVGGSISGSTIGTSQSGTVFSFQGRIGTVFIGGSIISGIDTSTGGSLVFNASIRSAKDIGSLTVLGSLVGHSNQGQGASPVVISASGRDVHGLHDRAIGKLTIGHRVERATILAGYDLSLQPSNSLAEIGPVKVGRDFIASNLVAGAQDTNNDGFGNSDDAFSGSAPGETVGIARLTIGGSVFGSSETGDRFGIEARHFGAIKIHGTLYSTATLNPIPFSTVTGNDIVIRAVPI